MTLPEAGSKSFWLGGSAWQFPDYDNADTFVDWQVRKSLLVREPVVGVALQGQLEELSLRTIQRRFLRATGVTHSVARQSNAPALPRSSYSKVSRSWTPWSRRAILISRT